MVGSLLLDGSACQVDLAQRSLLLQLRGVSIFCSRLFVVCPSLHLAPLSQSLTSKCSWLAAQVRSTQSSGPSCTVCGPRCKQYTMYMRRVASHDTPSQIYYPLVRIGKSIVFSIACQVIVIWGLRIIMITPPPTTKDPIHVCVA